MKLISTKIHGLLDYFGAVLLISLPWVFNFTLNHAQKNLPVVIGIIIIIYSLFTNYETGLVKLIPMKVHLVLDLVAGLILAASPWLFGFSHYFYLPHLISGLLIVLVCLLSERTVEYNRQYF